MKLKHMLLALIPLCMASCSEEETIVSGESQREVRVTAGASNHSRVVLNDEGNRISSLWEAGDKISLFTTTQSNLVYSTDTHAATATFTPVDEALECREGNTVYACYPEVSRITDEGMVVGLPSTTTMDYNNGSIRSFGYATSSISGGSVNFQFKHISAFIALEVKPEMLTDATKGISRITVSTSSSQPLSVGEGDTFDFSSLTASTGNGTNTVQINVDNYVVDSFWTVYIPVLPQPAGADITITLTDSEDQTLYTQTKPTPESGFLAGHTYHQKAVEAADVAYLVDGKTFNALIKQLASGDPNRSNSDDDYLIQRIEFVGESSAVPADYIVVSTEASPVPIYASFNPVDSLLTISTAAKRMEIVDASYMFFNCSSLESLDLSNFDTSNVTDMSSMFDDCHSLSSLDLSNFDTSNVTSMWGMFYYCSSLSSLDLSSFDTSNVTSMGDMFSFCPLSSLDLSNFDTSNVTDMASMFTGCYSLSSLDLSSFDTSNVAGMNEMFYDCFSLSSLDLSSFDTSNVTSMWGMFYGCSSLSSLDLSNFDTSSVTNMGDMFGGCSSLSSLDLSNFDTSNVTDMNQMFERCRSLESLDLSSFDTSNMTDMSSMFSDCYSLSSLDLFNFDTSNVTDMGGMFSYCSSLSSLDLSSFDTSSVTNMHYMFSGCSSLSSLDLSSFDTSNVTDMECMFYGCSSLSSLDLSGFDTSNVTYMYEMFYGCSSLESLNLSNFDTSNVTSMSYMFYGCSSLLSLDLSSFDMGHVTYMGEMFLNCAATSKACRVTSTKDLKDFLLARTSNTGMDPAWFIWGDAANGGSSLDEIPKEEW